MQIFTKSTCFSFIPNLFIKYVYLVLLCLIYVLVVLVVMIYEMVSIKSVITFSYLFY